METVKLVPGVYLKDGSHQTVVKISSVDPDGVRVYGRSYFYRDGISTEIDSKDKFWIVWKHTWERIYE